MGREILIQILNEEKCVLLTFKAGAAPPDILRDDFVFCETTNVEGGWPLKALAEEANRPRTKANLEYMMLKTIEKNK